MKNLLLLTFIVFSSLSSLAQDAYHNTLQSYLQSEYDLPTGDWVVNNTEIANLNAVQSWGCSNVIQDVNGQEFSKIASVNVPSSGSNPWDAGWKVDNNATIALGDKVLLVFSLRSISNNGDVSVFIERNSDYQKEVYFSTEFNENWTHYFIPFEASIDSYAPSEVSFGFHLADAQQELEIGGFTVINYGNTVDLDDLPDNLNNEQYGGFEADAPWREIAAQNIEAYRKANLNITAQKTDGTPIENGAFALDMVQHEYAFGSAVTASRIANNPDYNATYENKIRNLDGEGHGFNWVVFENDLKWDGWEEMWFVNHDQLVDAVAWLRNEDIQIRGHVLVWPGFQYMPDDIQDNAGNPNYIWSRIDDRLEEMLTYPGLEGEIAEWDVINELVVNTDLEPVFNNWNGNTTGREIYTDIFNRADELAPDMDLYYNDYVTMTLNNFQTGQYNTKKERLQEMLNAGAPIDAVGFQGHIGASPNSIYEVLGTLDDFSESFGLKAKITEFDMPPSVDEEFAGVYLRDFLTATFSHPSTNGFLFWNFWDGATWQNPSANIFAFDWSMKPAGETFVDLVFNEWWTDEQVTTNGNGVVEVRGFKGLHELRYVCNGEEITEMIDLNEDQEITITCDNLQTGSVAIALTETSDFSVFPNPAESTLHLEKTTNEPAYLKLTDVSGKVILEQDLQSVITQLNVEELSGIYFLEINQSGNRYFEKVVIK